MGEALGALVGEVLEFAGDGKGRAIGKCVRVKILLDITKPTLRWTSIGFGGESTMVLLRYEKLADFCYICGQLDHKDKDCSLAHPGAIRHYGPWLRADRTNPLSWDMVLSSLKWINTTQDSPRLLSNSPKSPTNKALPPNEGDNNVGPSKTRPARALSPIHFQGFDSPSSVGSFVGPSSKSPNTPLTTAKP